MSSPSSEKSFSSSSSCASRSSSCKSSPLNGLDDITNAISTMMSCSQTDMKHVKRRKVKRALKRRILRKEQPLVLSPSPDHIYDIDRLMGEEDSLEKAENLVLKEEKYAIVESAEEALLQKGIRPHMHDEVSTWLYEVCLTGNVESSTYMLAMNYVHRFLARYTHAAGTRSPFPRNLQLLAVTCLFIAYKFNEAKHPMHASALARLTENTWKAADILTMELEVLQTLSWGLPSPVPLSFLDRFLFAACVCETQQDPNQTQEKTGNSQEMIKCIASFFMECATSNSAFYNTAPSLIAASAIAIARAQLELPVWGRTFLHYSGYSEETISLTVKAMLPAGLNCRAPFLWKYEAFDASFKTKLIASAQAGIFAVFGAKVEQLVQPTV